MFEAFIRKNPDSNPFSFSFAITAITPDLTAKNEHESGFCHELHE